MANKLRLFMLGFLTNAVAIRLDHNDDLIFPLSILVCMYLEYRVSNQSEVL